LQRLPAQPAPPGRPRVHQAQRPGRGTLAAVARGQGGTGPGLPDAGRGTVPRRAHPPGPRGVLLPAAGTVRRAPGRSKRVTAARTVEPVPQVRPDGPGGRAVGWAATAAGLLTVVIRMALIPRSFDLFGDEVIYA